VTAPKGFKEAYQQYVEGGWPALSCDPEYGGQGLPMVMNTCVFEMLNSANQAWTMYPAWRTAPTRRCTRTAASSRRSCTCPS
jgi:alkylation response protein AidB-like acyl-CoA dehydrogenase